MNRLVIIGNGFDLAHGLPTSYRDFIDDYWANLKNSEHSDNFLCFENLPNYVTFEDCKNLEEISKSINLCDSNVMFSDAEIYTEFGNNFMTGSYPRQHILIYKNTFFKFVNKKKDINKWVDIENEYYRQLKKIVNSKCSDVLKTEEFWQKEQLKQVENLNKEFEQIKNLLEKYLNDSVETSYDFYDNDNNWAKFYEILKPISIYNNEVNLIEEFNDVEDRVEIKNLINIQKVNPDKLIKSTLCLNFNYTTTVNKYLENLKKGEINIDNIHIHGELLKEKNQINFGFGDEMDNDYKVIENINDNEYLRNFKSFQYLQNNNYDNLLRYVDSDKFQVLILGHSCGLSDRTLLNTIFEHDNCRSIKVFYHQKDDGTDIYTEIVQNISRHFNKKKLMREKIVNKTLCKPLPQIQLPKKEK
ncbi:hypothetical protein G6N05_10200 [Flavobacterium sp. F372]|uniref:Bacteriophage abortive infection AbiH n=1 Tax=Flavobacterium bernardetii TaxID=2813823 RepID=A0ABR7IZ25_9FLAO|nr:AbiH family protein [Flavobacterium bernardetii]MBC5834968.1 hypothetical protein [Flavobacterium bernardetii]NHF70479.1 hypothetical protein [Flavobacterium bernardetii]